MEVFGVTEGLVGRPGRWIWRCQGVGDGVLGGRCDWIDHRTVVKMRV